MYLLKAEHYNITKNFYFARGSSVKYCDEYVCLSVRISLEPRMRSLSNLLCMLPMAVAQYFSGIVAIRYVLTVLWMTSVFSSAVGHIAVWISLQRTDFA